MNGSSQSRFGNATSRIRNLIVVLGDQLSLDLNTFESFDKNKDAVWMAETTAEVEQVWSHKQRIALFLSAMRHFRTELMNQGIRVFYSKLEDQRECLDLVDMLVQFLDTNPIAGSVIMTEPGEWRLKNAFDTLSDRLACPLKMREDNSFLCSRKTFVEWATGRKQLRMEYFYREMRKREGILMEGASPAGGKWNYDASNRSSFGKSGPESAPSPLRHKPDSVTKDVLRLVEDRFPDHPGRLDTFAWPVSARDAEAALADFLKKGLTEFGKYQDAMWEEEPFLNHSLLSSSLNLKLISPRSIVKAVEREYQEGRVPLESAEGFIRQVIGWREYVRGVYWFHMPEYIDRNAMRADRTLPEFYWTGKTSLNCLKQCLKQTLDYGYAHHIQRLMVTGLFNLLWGTHPREVHRWYLAIYVDAVEWVELPNTLGMSQYADGGVMASKPYVSTGKYINRMSNYCKRCPFDPDSKSGENACPFTVLYWQYLIENERRLEGNPRMSLQLRNLKRLSNDQRSAILKQAERTRSRVIEEALN